MGNSGLVRGARRPWGRIAGLLMAATAAVGIGMPQGAGAASAHSVRPHVITPSVSLTVTPASPVTYGTSVTISARVKGSGSGAKPTGTLDFTANGNNIASCSAVRVYSALGKGSCTTTSLPLGSDNLVVNYSGDSNYAPASSEPVPYVVTNPAPSIQFTATPATTSPFGGSVTLKASLSGSGGTPTGTVEFQSNGSDITGCSAEALDGTGTAQCTTSALPIGTDSLAAIYSGNSTYTTVSANLSYTVTKLAPTVQLTASPVTNDPSGGQVTLTASVSGSNAGGTPTGTVDFESDGTSILTCSSVTLSNGQAQCTTTSLATGTDDLLAVYSGDSTYSPGSGALTYEVGQATPSVYLSVAPGTTSGQFVITAVVVGAAGVPAGNVQFEQGSNTIAGCASVALSQGSATCTTSSLSPGSNTLTAVYAGSGPYVGGHATITFNIALAVSQVHVTAVPPTGDTVGGSVTLNAQVSSSAGTPSGTVEFQANGVDLQGCSAVALDGTANAHCVTSTLPVGTDELAAIYSGDSNDNPNDDSLAYSVGKAVSVITLGAVPGTTSGQYVLTATASGAAGTPTGVVDFQDGGSDLSGCSAVALDGSGTATCTTSNLVPGANQLSATYSGDQNYLTGQSAITYDASLGNPGVTVAATPAAGASVGNLVTITATVAGSSATPSGTVEFQSNATDIPGCSAVTLDTTGTASCTTTGLAAGSDALTALYSGDSRFNAASGALSYTVAHAPAKLYLSAAPGATSGQFVLTAVAVGAAGIPTGTVEFEQSGVAISGCSAGALGDGSATCTTSGLAPGPNSLTAVYSGDAVYDGSNASITYDISLATPTVGLAAAPSTTDTFGASVTFTATVTPPASASGDTPGGTVEFQADGSDIPGCSSEPVGSGGTATCTTSGLGVGSDQIAALYSGDSSNNPVSASLVYAVGEAAPSVVVTATGLGTDVVGDAVTITATVTGPGAVPTGLVRFSSGSTGIAGCLAVRLSTSGIATCNTKKLATGSDTLGAAYSGDNLFTAGSGTLAYTVRKAHTSIAFLARPTSKGVEGEILTFKVKLSGQAARPSGHVKFLDGTKLIPGCHRVRVRRGVATCHTETLSLGTHRIVAKYLGNRDYFARSAHHRFTVVHGGYWIASVDGSTRAYGPVATSGNTGIGCTAVAIVTAPDTDGFWIVCSNGTVHSRGKAAHLKSIHDANVIAAAATPDGKGLWLLSSNGSVRQVGDAKALNLIQKGSKAPVSAIASTLDGKGLWVAHTDGSVTRYGDAEPLGFTGSQRLNGVIDGIVTSPKGQGYGLVAKDGGVFSFGTFRFFGSLAARHLASPIVAIALTPLGDGYLLVGRNGTVYPFGAARLQTAHPGTLHGRVVGIALQD